MYHRAYNDIELPKLTQEPSCINPPQHFSLFKLGTGSTTVVDDLRNTKISSIITNSIYSPFTTIITLWVARVPITVVAAEVGSGPAIIYTTLEHKTSCIGMVLKLVIIIIIIQRVVFIYNHVMSFKDTTFTQ